MKSCCFEGETRRCSTCGGPTIRQNVISTSARHYHRHLTDCVAFLLQLQASIKGVPDDMRVKEILHLQTEASTGIVYGQVILEKI